MSKAATGQSSSSSSSSAPGSGELGQEQIVSRINEMIGKQRSLSSKIGELESECREHELVIETLQTVAPERRCFRMLGGVLIERTAGEVLPQLKTNRDNMRQVITKLATEIEESARSLEDFKRTHNVRFVGETMPSTGAASPGSPKSVIDPD